MAKINYAIVPPGWLPLLQKILRWYDQRMHPTVAGRSPWPTRAGKSRLKGISFFKEIADVWNPLSSAIKDAWASAATECGTYRYRLFTSDYSLRKKAALSLPGTPSDFHQMQGLTFKNPAGAYEVRAIWKTISLTGQITVKFNYKKVENDTPADYSFRVYCKAWYFEDGQNKSETHTWTSPTGNVDWNAIEFSFGTANRYYFEVEFFFQLDHYDAVVDIDNLKIDDKSGEVYYEYFNPKRPLLWDPTLLVRKEGWTFEPSWDPTYLEHMYLG